MDDISRELRENPKLMELAKAAAKMNDLTADEAMDQILRTPELPLPMPDSFTFLEAQEKFAEALGKSRIKLTDEEKQHAILNAILAGDHIDG